MTLPTLRPRAALTSPLPLSPDRLRAVIVIVAGVAGSGKTTVGTQLATRLGWRFADADGFHSAANVAKMRAGIPLTDKDRAPRLAALPSRGGAVAGRAAVRGGPPFPRPGPSIGTSCCPGGPPPRWSSSW